MTSSITTENSAASTPVTEVASNVIEALKGAKVITSIAPDIAALTEVTSEMVSNFELPVYGTVSVTLNTSSQTTGETGWLRFDREVAEQTTDEGFATDAALRAWRDGGRDAFKIGRKYVHEIKLDMAAYSGIPAKKVKLAILVDVAHKLTHWVCASAGVKDMSGGGRHNAKFVAAAKLVGLNAEIVDGTIAPELTLMGNGLSGDAKRSILEDFEAGLPDGWSDAIVHRLATPKMASAKSPRQRVRWSCQPKSETNKNEDGSPTMRASFDAGIKVTLTCNQVTCGEDMKKVPSKV